VLKPKRAYRALLTNCPKKCVTRFIRSMRRF
jgi:hypothetical protein